MHSIEDREDLEKLEELAWLQNQVEKVRLQYKLGKKNFLENIKKIFEPIIHTIKSTSENLTKTNTETSTKKNKALKNLNGKLWN